MDNRIREITLANGLAVAFLDHTRLYYGDYYVVRLEIRCEVPLRADYFGSSALFEEAKALLGDSVTSRRFVERVGVPSTEIDRVRGRLMENFERHSLGYFQSADFPGKLVLAELEKAKKKRGRPGAL